MITDEVTRLAEHKRRAKCVNVRFNQKTSTRLREAALLMGVPCGRVAAMGVDRMIRYTPACAPLRAGKGKPAQV